jgi:inner membrane protein
LFIYFELQSALNKVKNYSSINIAARIWLFTFTCTSAAIAIIAALDEPVATFGVFPLSCIASGIASLPAFGVLAFFLPLICKARFTVAEKIFILVLLNLFITLLYGSVAGIVYTFFDQFDLNQFLQTTAICTGVLFGSSCIAVAIDFKRIRFYFQIKEEKRRQIFQSLITTNMEATKSPEAIPVDSNRTSSNKILIKGLITGLLILILLIPTFFISGLISDRQERNEQIVNEASSSWATSQMLSGPYLFIPYKAANQYVIVLPENLEMNGTVTPEDRKRSIYQILLYRSSFSASGNFIFNLSKEIDTSALQFSNAKICMGISDFKGIEDKISVNFNGNAYELSPGLPNTSIDSTGLSAPVQLSETDLAKNISFSFKLNIKGSGQLHFMPLAGNSTYALASNWNSPSFKGNTLPVENRVDEKGFTAKWIFNKANLPFPTVLQKGATVKKDIAFGVTILQPVDDYAKTARSVKYAVLFIGLTFSLFFIVEIMQKKPVHPVQYILVGMSLIIFYTLLLSISEFIHFDDAYLIASIATVSLISLYAQSHFKKWKIAALFALVLGCLYGFNYVLISLEDTALLVGSVGLFVVLAIVMYASRKIDWYGASPLTNTQTEIAS